MWQMLSRILRGKKEFALRIDYYPELRLWRTQTRMAASQQYVDMVGGIIMNYGQPELRLWRTQTRMAASQQYVDMVGIIMNYGQPELRLWRAHTRMPAAYVDIRSNMKYDF
ncbi:MAG: hypothetical protein ACNA7I_03710 [Candidatus Methanoperedens sp.]